jgi:hypothetical protein
LRGRLQLLLRRLELTLLGGDQIDETIDTDCLSGNRPGP